MSDTLAPDLVITRADFADPADAAAIVAMLDVYARDPMGGGEPLSDDVRERLVPALAQVPGAFVLLARLDGEAVGIANCFTGFSTFAARPLVNIHDIAVAPGHRGKGIARALFAAIEVEARKRGACKITLEVLSGNQRAKELYASLGYGDYQLDPETGHALFWQKRLS
ncbi:GNAT family N-acetyltransferase [Novosphingobium resinovorum]|uniref:GNAT family N-acetyltransferase n=1 Tax=Novosphingobium resinovorum TaxID=158500 RepID=A0A1D8A692_9SPHN|nr:GNAT family N-acetyltransferase [Novosphingobium resinovorum]AOR77626.1 GNAT family N-acetyltransferase [Novosphingobium resinovorum]